MNSFWTILIEINLILSIVYLGYMVFLKNLTFFRWTRTYLLGGMLTALVYPFLKIRQVVSVPAEGVNIIIPNISQVSQTQSFDYNQWAVYTVSAIFLLLFVRFLIRFFSLGKIHFASDNAEFNGRQFRNTHQQVNPFSFWKWIYIHRESHSDFEMRQIVTHEHIHTRERHTFDVLVAEICTIICWYNPLVRLLTQAVKDNLEFLTDAEVLHSGINKISYQHSLVGISLSGFPQPRHGNQFAFKTLKRRIKMMNKAKSSKYRLLSFMVVAPTVLGVASLLTFSCQKESLDTIKSAEKGEGIALTGKGKVEFGELKMGDGLEDSYAKENLTFERTISAETGPDGKTNITNVEVKALEGEKQLLKLHADNITFTDPNTITLNRPVIVTGPVLSTAKEKPLILVDGEEVLSFDNMKPENIQSITVLKDKNALSKYGEKAKNGAILIYTKSGVRH